MSTNNDNNNNDGVGKPKDDRDPKYGSDEEDEPTEAELKAAELSDMETGEALLAIRSGAVPDFQQYPDGASEKRKRDIDEINALFLNNYGVRMTVTNARESVGAIDVSNLDDVLAVSQQNAVAMSGAARGAPSAAPAPAPSRLQQVIAQREEATQRRLAEHQDH